jgi:hypothetical protein
MSKQPQQPELRRAGLGSTSQDGVELRAGDQVEPADDHAGPVPKENRPGHRPEKEQDKPDLG